MLACAVLGAVVGAGHLIGRHGRQGYSAEQQRVTVDSATDGFRFLYRAGIRGRVLVLLDHRTRITPTVHDADFLLALESNDAPPPVEELDLVSGLILSGVAREVWVVVPREDWKGFASRIGATRDSLREGAGFRRRFYGAPVHLHPGDSLPSLEDTPVVYALSGDLGSYDPELVDLLTDPGVADIVVIEEER